MAVTLDRPRTPAARPRHALRRLRARRPGRLAYLALLAVAFFSAFPFYYAVVVASQDNAVLSQVPPPLLPGGNLAERTSSARSAAPR
jgi:cellobiose transport system permease protein